jgi:glutaredoxin-like protein NrdH
MKTIVYTLPNCSQCDATKRLMTANNIEFDELALQDYPDKAQEFIEQGHKSAPIVDTGSQVWSGFKYEEIKALAQYLDTQRGTS